MSFRPSAAAAGTAVLQPGLLVLLLSRGGNTESLKRNEELRFPGVAGTPGGPGPESLPPGRPEKLTSFQAPPVECSRRPRPTSPLGTLLTEQALLWGSPGARPCSKLYGELPLVLRTPSPGSCVTAHRPAQRQLVLRPWAHPLGALHGLICVCGSLSPGEKPPRLKDARHRQEEDVTHGPASAVHRHTPTTSWAGPSAGGRYTEAPTHTPRGTETRTLLTMWQPPCH